MNEDVEALLTEQDPEVAATARALIRQIEAAYPEAVVSVDGGDVGFGSGRGYKGLRFVVSPHKAHVTLGISGGVGLPDPAGLMEGKGKVHRHVKVRTPEEAARPELVELLRARMALE
ncbi:MAG: hypothetical protein HOV79_07575 [Hamadaea sp.]|nr:hypothetical protein [Hamadaea sp.]